MPAKTTAARTPYDIDKLTDVALRVFAERGFDGSSMDDVARAAGIAKASLYHHVSGKEELLKRGVDRALDALFRVLTDAKATSGRPIDKLRYIIGRVARLAFEVRFELTVLTRVRGNSTTERDAIARRRDFDKKIAAIVRDAQNAGEVDATIDASLVARLVFGMINSIIEWYRPGGPLPSAVITDAIVQVVFNGIAAV